MRCCCQIGSFQGCFICSKRESHRSDLAKSCFESHCIKRIKCIKWIHICCDKHPYLTYIHINKELLKSSTISLTDIYWMTIVKGCTVKYLFVDFKNKALCIHILNTRYHYCFTSSLFSLVSSFLYHCLCSLRKFSSYVLSSKITIEFR